MALIRAASVGLCWSLAVATRVAAQEARTDVHGVVFDSLRGRPLAGATVQFTPVPTTGAAPPAGTWSAPTDSRGRYRLTGLPPGRYLAGFFHPLLDSLGFAAEPRRVVIGPAAATVDFGIPSAATIVGAVCPGRAANDSSALLVGHVRRAGTSEALGGAAVAATWTELVQEAVLVKPHEREVLAPVTREGWFAVCGIAAETPVLVRAVAGADSSGYVRLRLPARGLAHQPFYIGPTGPRARGKNRTRVTGTVRDAQGRPVANAQAQVWGGDRSALSSARGEFALDSVPVGTQTVEVRAIGYVPVARVVHLTTEPSTLEVVLAEPVTTLPTTTVTVRPSTSLRMKGFYQRMADVERGINRGYFFTPEELERRKPPKITNIFDGLPGIHVERPQDRLGAVVRGPLQYGHAGNASRCRMAVFLDGIQIIGGLGSDDPRFSLDRTITPSQVAAVEVYPHPVSAPPQYQMLSGTCGIILLWTR